MINDLLTSEMIEHNEEPTDSMLEELRDDIRFGKMHYRWQEIRAFFRELENDWDCIRYEYFTSEPEIPWDIDRRLQ